MHIHLSCCNRECQAKGLLKLCPLSASCEGQAVVHCVVGILTRWHHWLSIELSKLRLRWPGAQAPEETPFWICARWNSGPVPGKLLLDRLQTLWVHHTPWYLHSLWGCTDLQGIRIEGVGLIAFNAPAFMQWSLPGQSKPSQAPLPLMPCSPLKENDKACEHLVVKLRMHIWHLGHCGLAEVALHHVEEAVRLRCAHSGVPHYETASLLQAGGNIHA